MSLIATLRRRLGGNGGVAPAVTPEATTPAEPAVRNETLSSPSLAEIFQTGDYAATSSMTVNEKTAMCVSAVYASVGLISGAFVCMPFQFFRKSSDGREAIENHHLTDFLNVEPIPFLSSAVFWEYLLTSYLFHGDAFARIVRAGPRSPEIIGFEPWHPEDVDVLKVGGRLKYVLSSPDNGERFALDQDDMLHVPGLGFNGKRGLSLIKHALRGSAGIALAADDYSASFFANGARPDFAIVNKGERNLTAEQQQRLRENWDAVYRGPSNRHRPAILDGGLELKEVTLSAEDAALIAQRKFQVIDIARLFGVPPFMIGETEKQTSFGTGVDGMSINFIKYTVMRHARKFETEIKRKCLRGVPEFGKFNADAIERGDLLSRYQAYRVAVGRAGEPGFATVNQIRKFEDWPRIDGGDELYRGGNDQSAVKTSGQQP